MNIVNINSKNSLKTASKVFLEGGILIFPTDTVYGIGCLLKEESIIKLYKIKNRPLSQPTAILIPKKLYACLKASFNINDSNIEKSFLDGKVTLLIKKDLMNIKLQNILIKDNKVGVRMPQYSWISKLIDEVGPIVASSANMKGKPTPKNFINIDNKLLEQIDLAIRTKEDFRNHPSAVYNLETKEYLRK